MFWFAVGPFWETLWRAGSGSRLRPLSLSPGRYPFHFSPPFCHQPPSLSSITSFPLCPSVSKEAHRENCHHTRENASKNKEKKSFWGTILGFAPCLPPTVISVEWVDKLHLRRWGLPGWHEGWAVAVQQRSRKQRHRLVQVGLLSVSHLPWVCLWWTQGGGSPLSPLRSWVVAPLGHWTSVSKGLISFKLNVLGGHWLIWLMI